MLISSTLSSNVVNDYGGAIFNSGTLTMLACTVSGNVASSGGAIYNNGAVYLTNCIAAGNTPDNMDGSFGGVNNLTSGNPLLAPLGNYGGPTQTMPPLPGSPAINAGAATSLATDQRGFPRVLGAAQDIGAVEGIYNAAGPGKLTGMTRLGNGSTKFTFTNYTDTSFTVLASTNVALPAAAWTILGPAVESPAGSGQFQFADPQATNYLKRFYRVQTP